jgi:hypothetical protein
MAVDIDFAHNKDEEDSSDSDDDLPESETLSPIPFVVFCYPVRLNGYT